tara:strand:+ start:1143 stop:1970 length:828 start_codon:yes stop_codon:yes gene_type:complete
MTKKTELRLLQSIELGIESVTGPLDEVRNSIKKVKLMTNFMAEHELSTEDKLFDNVEKLLEYRVLIGLIYLDLSSSIRAYLKSKYAYEQLFSTKQILVIINEGYKQIYGFVKVNEKGDSITKYRNKSYWYEDIQVIINESLPELRGEYDSLTKKLDDYFTTNFDSIKEQRDLSVHYDRKASKVYDMINGLDIEGTFKKLLPFLEILIEMFRFTEKMALTSSIKEKEKTNEMNLRLESTFDKLIDKVSNSITENNEVSLNDLVKIITKTKTDILSR